MNNCQNCFDANWNILQAIHLDKSKGQLVFDYSTIKNLNSIIQNALMQQNDRHHFTLDILAIVNLYSDLFDIR